MACVATVLAVALLFRLLANHTLGRNGILLALLVAQGTAACYGNRISLESGALGRTLVQRRGSGKAGNRAESVLDRSAAPSNSFLAPFLAKGSGFVNFSGGYVLGPDGANAARVSAMIERSAPHLRVLVGGDRNLSGYCATRAAAIGR